MSFKKYNRKRGLMLSFFLFISTILSVLVIPLPITKAAPSYSWATYTIAESGDDVEFLADNGWSNFTTDEDNLWVHSNEYTTYAWLRFEGLSAITNAGGIIDQIILGMYSGVDVGADYEEVPGGYVSVACPMYAWDFELTEVNILAADMNPIASFDGDNLSPSGAWYNKTISNNDPRDWYAWSTDFNDVFTCYVAGFMEYSPDWTYYRSFTSFDEGHPAKLYVKYHIGTGYENVLSEFDVDWASYAGSWNDYNFWVVNIAGENRTGEGADVNWNLLNVTQLTEIDSGSDLTLNNATWVTVAHYQDQVWGALYNDTGSANIETFFLRFKINVTNVNNVGAGNTIIPGVGGLSTSTPVGGGGLPYGANGEWVGIITWCKDDDQSWRFSLHERSGAGKIQSGYSQWFNEGSGDMLYVEFRVNVSGATKWMSYDIYDDPEFTNSIYNAVKVLQMGITGPFRYPQIVPSLGAGIGHSIWNQYYTYLEMPIVTDGYVATAPNGTVITPDPFEELDDCVDFVEEWDALYGPVCWFYGATLYEADGVTVNTDGWLFMGEVYVVKAEIKNFTTFYLELDDGKNKVRFNYVNATKSLNIEASEFVAGLVQGTVTLNATTEKCDLAWKFILNKNILDVPIGQNMTYYGVNTPKEQELSGTAITGVMIYNLGGHVTYDFEGDAGKKIGGDALEVHHTNSTGTGAYVDVMFRRMQHVHLAFSLDVEDNDCFDHDENSGIVQLGFKYWDGAEWDDLYYVELSIVNGAVDPVAGDGKAFIIPYSSWNSRQSNGVMTTMKSDTLSGYPECSDDVNSQITYTKFYLDLWFNTMNSSTTVGGRLSTKYFGMVESPSWFFWSNWKPVMVNQTESMFFDDLRDEDGDILQISDIELVKFFIRVLKTGAGAGSCDSHTWTVSDPEFSKTLAADRMQAINTPEGIDTLVIDMPSTGFMQPLTKAISGISNMIWAGALNFIKILISSMDTIAVWIGFPAGTFSQISNYVLTITEFMFTLITHFGNILLNMGTQISRLFSIIAIGIPQMIYGTGILVTTIVSYLTQIISLFTGGWSGLSNFWANLSLAQWIELFVVAVLPFMWLARVVDAKDSFKTAREDIGFIFKLLFALIDLGSWLIQMIGTMIQAIRNILPI